MAALALILSGLCLGGTIYQGYNNATLGWDALMAEVEAKQLAAQPVQVPVPITVDWYTGNYYRQPVDFAQAWGQIPPSLR